MEGHFYLKVCVCVCVYVLYIHAYIVILSKVWPLK
jgi:hypothetical protein